MLIALANSKGGVGKTTVSVHYAVAQAERGRKTALIDSDAQGSSTRWLQDIQDSVAVFPLKTADDVIDQAPRIVSQFDVVVADGPAGLSEVTRALLPCGQALWICGRLKMLSALCNRRRRYGKGPKGASCCQIEEKTRNGI